MPQNKSQLRKGSIDQIEGRISWPTRVAYAGGDVACNIVFGMIGTLLTMFYTDYAFISAGTIGIIMLVSRIFDGFSDVIMGIIVDKTHSRFGKARPWLLWMSLPFCISAVLLFTVPGVGVKGDPWYKVLYVFITYNFCTTICYTAINLPYGTLSTLMTDKSHERDMLGNVRMGLSPIGKIIAVVATLPLVTLMGNNQWAWAKTMSIWAAVAFVLLLINFITCKETIKTPSRSEQKEDIFTKKKNDPKKLPMKKALKFLVTNKYFWMVLLLWMFQSVSFGVIGTILPYFCKWVILDQNLYSILFLVETLTLVGCVFICMPLMKKIGKRNLALIGAVICLIGQIVYIFKPTSVGMIYMSCIVRSIGLAPLNAVVFGMLGDVVDYGHWKTGFRQESFICAGGSVGTKLGSGLSSVLITQLLQVAGYNGALKPEEGGRQTEFAKTMITNIYIIGPIVIAAGVIIVLLFYNLDKKYDKMKMELFDRIMIEKTEDEAKAKRLEKELKEKDQVSDKKVE